MRWSDYQKHIKRNRRPYMNKNNNKADIDNSTKENDDYDIIEDVDEYKKNKMNNNQNNYKQKPTNQYYENIKKMKQQYKQQGYMDNENNQYNKDYEEPPKEAYSNTEEVDLVSTLQKLFKGNNDMVNDIIDTLQETGILENFREPLNIIDRVYGPMLDGNNNHNKTPMWAYNKANRRIKYMQKQHANQKLHSEMYNMILKQVKDMLVSNYGSRIKNNMPVLFDQNDEDE